MTVKGSGPPVAEGGTLPTREAEDVAMRLTASLDEGRFDVRKLGVREALLALLIENRALSQNLSSVQTRSSELINKARDWRKRLLELGDPDPGPP